MIVLIALEVSIGCQSAIKSIRFDLNWPTGVSGLYDAALEGGASRFLMRSSTFLFSFLRPIPRFLDHVSDLCLDCVDVFL